MRDIELIVNSETGFVTTGKNSAIKQENLQRKIIYKFNGEFVDGTAYLCVKKEDGVTGKIQMTKNGEQYELVIKNGLVSNTRSILINIKIVQAGSENNVPVFVSTVSQIKIEDTIQADMDMIDYYPDWHDSIEGQLAGKVDKEEGKSLIANSEIERLADVHNYDDTEIKEDISRNTEDIDTIKQKNTEQDEEIAKKAGKNEIPDVSNFITNTVNDLLNYYLKSETYNKSEVDQRISQIPKFAIEVVQALPVENISPTTLYLLVTGDESQNLYTEYIYANNSWEKLGTQSVDLTNYVQFNNYAKADKAGVFKPANWLVVDGGTGDVFAGVLTEAQYKNASNSSFIGKGTLENIINYLVNKAVEELSLFADYVRNTDYGTYNKAGVLKPSNALRISESSGEVSVATRTLAQYLTEQNGIFIGKGTLENVLTQYTKSDTVKNIVVTTEEPVNPDNNTLYILAKEE